ncbi:MAG: M67 family metallopeptidase [Elusimicrobia bacterium]|nr:M67 family metallopeptidase [Elusimicrobiota bacterium]
MSLRISQELVGRIRRHAEEKYPQECCGFLAGPLSASAFSQTDRVLEVAEVHLLKNHWEGPDRRRRYQIDPRFFAALESRYAGTGEGILGFYHSHPESPAEPSAFDAERAWPWYCYLIVSVQGGKARELRSWTLEEAFGKFLEEAVEVSQAASPS